jgi:uridylate kinase
MRHGYKTKHQAKNFIQFLYSKVLPARVGIIDATVLFLVTTKPIVIIVVTTTNTTTAIEKLIQQFVFD